MGPVLFWRIASMLVRFTCVFQHRTKYSNRCCQYYVFVASYAGMMFVAAKWQSHVHTSIKSSIYFKFHMQICHIIRKVKRDLKKPECKGWPLGKVRALEEKKSRRKKIVSKLHKSKGTPARDPKARTRQEKTWLKRWKQLILLEKLKKLSIFVSSFCRWNLFLFLPGS